MTEREILPPVVVAAETDEAQPPIAHPQTLAATLQGKKDLLTPSESRAVIAADALRGTVHTKEVLFKAHIFFARPIEIELPSGVLRGMQLGFASDDVVEARDFVRTMPRYERLWRQHQLLMQPKFAEVAVYKRAKKTHAEIAEKLGVEKQEVEKISRRLADFGITEDKRRHAREFEAFCREVEKEDKEAIEAGRPPLPTMELATDLSSSEQRVGRARRRNRVMGKASAPGRNDIIEIAAAKKRAIQKAITVNPNKSDEQITQELEELSVTAAQVQHARRESLIERILQRKTPLLK